MRIKTRLGPQGDQTHGGSPSLTKTPRVLTGSWSVELAPATAAGAARIGFLGLQVLRRRAALCLPSKDCPVPKFLDFSPWSGQESQAPLGDDLDIAAQILLFGSLNQLPDLPDGDPSTLIYFCRGFAGRVYFCPDVCVAHLGCLGMCVSSTGFPGHQVSILSC